MPRLLLCLDCQTLSKLPDYVGDPHYDMALEDVVQRHQHNEIPEAHRKGGNLMSIDQQTYDKIDFETQIKSELAKNHIEIKALRDELGEDAVVCHQKHGQPAWPGKPCIDYQNDALTIGRKIGVPPGQRQFLCTYCPYESTITVAKRHKRGMYK